MLTRNERMEKINKAGFDTSKYYTINVNESIPAGSKIHIVVDKDGNYVPEIVKETKNDPIYNQIIEDGYVRNTKLFRRFVMAQMFSNLNYVSYDGQYRGYNDCIKHMYGYEYTLKMMTEEVRVLSKLEARDKDSFVERSNFFTKDVVITVLEDYIAKLKEYVDALPDRHCKGVPYKRIKGVNIFNEDLDKKLYSIIRTSVFRIRHAKNYTEIYRALEAFMRNHVKLPFETAKSKVWIDTYKGEGAYYTLKNLIMFHGCEVVADEFMGYKAKLSGMNAMRLLDEKLYEYKGEGWRLFAFMKKVIEDNGINTATYIAEICNK